MKSPTIGLFRRARSKYWYMRVWKNGRDIAVSTKETSKGAAQIAAQLILKSLDVAADDKKHGVILARNALTEFLTGMQRRSSSYYSEVARILISQFLAFSRVREVSDITAALIDAYIVSRRAQGRKEKTIKNDFDIIKAFMVFCEARGYIRKNPAGKVGRQGGVADVGIDFDVKGPADNHRL